MCNHVGHDIYINMNNRHDIVTMSGIRLRHTNKMLKYLLYKKKKNIFSINIMNFKRTL